MTTTTTTSTTNGTRPSATPDPDRVLAAVRRRSYAVIATTSSRARPHAAGVVFQLVGTDLWISTDRSSRKARNVAANPHVAMSIPVRRVPVGPPAQVHFQATAAVVDPDAPDVRALLDGGHLDGVTGHGELDRPDACFLRVALPSRLHTYGLGLSLVALARHPLDAAGTVQRP
ncbi:MAG: pyridoxamine 5'-phosphate oxidase family protein [Actinomycetota bacterium]|nr:pyridoxamine 5'-phosphate oxidase family protein [Acidimicrobiia bacterium]MDQ3294153.1 pyridoxamine 5'-phosphate oxidase family protein [Actinomycetota bacterium]